MGKKLSNNTVWPKKSYAWFVTIILLITYTVSFIDRAIINFLYDPIKKDLGLSETEMGYIGGYAFAFSYILLSLPVGRIVDKFNRIFVLIFGVVLWSFATAAHGFSRDYYSLFISRSGVGAGEASVTPAAWSIIADLFRPEDRAFPMSFYLMRPYVVQGIALFFGAFIAQIFVEPVHYLGITFQPWQMTFILVAIPGIFIAIILFFMRDPKRQNKEENINTNYTFKDVLNYIKNNFIPYFTLLIGAALIVILLYAYQFQIPTYIYRVHGWDLSKIGYQFGLVTILSGCLGVLSGPILEKYFAKRGFVNSWIFVFLISSGFLAIVAPMIFYFLTDVYFFSLSLVLVCMFFVGFFITLPMSVFALALQKITPSQFRGSIAGIYVFVMNIFGLTFGYNITPYFTEFIFKNDNLINLSLGATFLIFGPLSFLIFLFGRNAFNKALLENNN